MPGFVYILKDTAGKFYIGSTDNLQRRLRQHELGHTQTSRNMKNPCLVFSQEYITLAKARSIEQKIKSWKRRDFIEKIIAEGYIKVT